MDLRILVLDIKKKFVWVEQASILIKYEGHEKVKKFHSCYGMVDLLHLYTSLPNIYCLADT